MKATSQYNTSGSYVVAVICWATWNISVKVIAAASDVSLIRLMKEFDSGGTDTLAACGKIILRSD